MVIVVTSLSFLGLIYFFDKKINIIGREEKRTKKISYILTYIKKKEKA